jgi:nucleotide-binding universal stress UspA family protein
MLWLEVTLMYRTILIAAGIDVPVLVIRASHMALRAPRKVLVAVDGSPASDEAVAETGAVAARAGAEVLALHVQHMVAVQGVAIVEPEAEAHAIVDRAVEELGAHRVRARGETMIDHSVAAAIVAAADAFGADLVVIGSRRPTGIGGILLGSVGHEVVSRMRRPVLLARRVRDSRGYATRFDERARDIADPALPAAEAARLMRDRTRATPLGGRLRRPSVWRRLPGRPPSPVAAARRGDPMAWA